MDYNKILSDIYDEIRPLAGKGKQADYIPELAKVDRAVRICKGCALGL